MNHYGYNMLRVVCGAHSLNTIAKKLLIWLNVKRIAAHFHMSAKSTTLLLNAQHQEPKYTLPTFCPTRFLSAEPVFPLQLFLFCLPNLISFFQVLTKFHLLYDPLATIFPQIDAFTDEGEEQDDGDEPVRVKAKMPNLRERNAILSLSILFTIIKSVHPLRAS